MTQYADITPDHLAFLSLRRSAQAIEGVIDDPRNWFFMILDLNRAIYCALIATLSGTAHIGVYQEKLAGAWLDYFEKSRKDPDELPPTAQYVLPFTQLLERAERGTADMLGPALALTPQQRSDILKLNEFRNDLEHVKPQTWSLATDGLPRMCASAAVAFEVLLQSFLHHLERHELEILEGAISRLKQFGTQYPSTPPSGWKR